MAEFSYKEIIQDFNTNYPVGTYEEFDDFRYGLIAHLRGIVDSLVRNHIADFGEDCATIGISYGRGEKTKFVFIARENGTWLFEKDYDDFLNEKESYQSFETMTFNYGKDFCAFAIWFDAHNESYKIERKF